MLWVWCVRVLCLFLLDIFFAIAEVEPERQYSVIIDAGSTGSRVYIYSFEKHEPIVNISEVSSKKIGIALSTLTYNDDSVGFLIRGLLEHAEQEVPQASHRYTPISLKATAGVRQLPSEEQEWLIHSTLHHLSRGPFTVDARQTRVLSGAEEALFDWMAVSFAFHSTRKQTLLSTPPAAPQSTPATGTLSNESDYEALSAEVYAFFADVFRSNGFLGASDMGGSSLQLAYTVPPSPVGLDDRRCPPDWTVRPPGYDRPTGLVARSLVGMGIIDAMSEVLDTHDSNNVSDPSTPHEASRITGAGGSGSSVDSVGSGSNVVSVSVDGSGESVVITSSESALQGGRHPCLSLGEYRPGSIHNYQYSLYGSGNWSGCLNMIRERFESRIAAAVDLQCLKRHRPRAMIGMDTIPKALHMLGLSDDPLAVSPEIVMIHGTQVCSSQWKEVLHRNPGVMAYRAQRACFAAAYIYFLLVDVFGVMPEESGVMVPLDEHLHYELSWVLGAVVAEDTGPSVDITCAHSNCAASRWAAG